VNSPARRREVTADGMTRVAAVVAAMVESSSDEESSSGTLTDLIAKAAQVVEHHAGATRILRTRGLAQRGRANASLMAATRNTDAAPVHKLDVTR